MSVKLARQALRSMYNGVQSTSKLSPAEKKSYNKLLIALGHDLNECTGIQKKQTIDEIVNLGNFLIDSKLNNVKDALDAEIINIKRS